MVNGCLDGVIRVGFVDVWVTAISNSQRPVVLSSSNLVCDIQEMHRETNYIIFYDFLQCAMCDQCAASGISCLRFAAVDMS